MALSGLADFVPDQLEESDVFFSNGPVYADFPTVMEKALAWIRESTVGGICNFFHTCTSKYFFCLVLPSIQFKQNKRKKI